MIPLATLVVGLHLDKRDSRREAGIGEATTAAQRYATSFESFAGEIESFMDAAAIVIGQEAGISDTTNGYLAQLASRYPTLRAIFITDTNGMLIAQSDPDGGIGRDLSDRPYVTELQAGKESTWTQALPALDTGEVIATFSRTIRGSDGNVRAFLVAAFHPSNLTEQVSSILGEDDNFVIIDAAGQVAFTARPSNISLQDLGDDPLVQRVLSGEVVVVNDDKTPFDAGHRYGAIVPVSTMGWAIGYTKSMSALNSDLLGDLLRNLSVLLLIMLAVMVAILLMARQITRPLRALVRSAAQVGEGAYPTTDPLSNAPPDVLQLQHAFAEMSDAVRGREAQLTEQAQRVQSLEQAGASIASGLDYESTVQSVTDAGRSLTGAQIAAFFYNVRNEEGEEYLLHTLSGVPIETMANFPQPRNTAIFGPTFRGEGPVRLDDVTSDPRYGQSPPFNGMPEGHPPVHSYLAVPVLSADGSVLGGLFFGHPAVGVFTEQHETLALRLAAWATLALDNARLYRQAQEVQEELRRANLAKDEFLGLISHELRTPVTTIYGGLRLLATHKELLEGDQADEFIETMADEGARLVRLIEDLLALTRVQLGKEIDLAPARVNDLVGDSISQFSRLRKTRSIDATLADNLPPIAVESTYFKQILTNLLSNADKYSPPQEPIEVTTSLEGAHVLIVVSDHGPGVDAEEADKIFDSFFRSQKTVSLAAGQGLGLTVCRTLVQAQQGEIWARNRESGGLSVGFSFPAMTSTGEEDPETTAGAMS